MTVSKCHAFSLLNVMVVNVNVAASLQYCWFPVIQGASHSHVRTGRALQANWLMLTWSPGCASTRPLTLPMSCDAHQLSWWQHFPQGQSWKGCAPSSSNIYLFRVVEWLLPVQLSNALSTLFFMLLFKKMISWVKLKRTYWFTKYCHCARQGIESLNRGS